MLKRPPSLSSRAALIFVSIYLVIFFAVLTVIASTNSGEPGDEHHAGPQLALSLAATELHQTPTGMQFPANGEFARLRARNPSLWLMGRSGDKSFSFGPVPPAARDLFGRFGGAIENAQFSVPAIPRPLATSAIERRQIGAASFLLAAGGVDPTTLSFSDTLRFFLNEGTFVVLIWIAILGLVAMFVALPFMSRAIRPITAEAGSIGGQDPGRRLDEAKAPRELLPLVRGFNAALTRLEAELGRRKRFIADVAHELRTPLAVISLRVEALEKEPGKRDLKRAVDGLAHLVAQMLDLERLSLAGREHQPIDLAAATRDVVADLAPVAIDRGYELSLDAPDAPVTVSGDPHAVARAITNLVSNSIAHGGGGGAIQVVVTENRKVEVKDEGPGVPSSLQPRLFEPFCRGSNPEGCGLGLHLTREIMRAHGGEVRLLGSARGASFRLTFPPPGERP